MRPLLITAAMTLACIPAADGPVGGESESSSESDGSGSDSEATETETETETGGEDPCGACQADTDACSASEGATIEGFSFWAENLSEYIDGSFNFEQQPCVVDSIDTSDVVTLTATCAQGLTTILYSATPPAPPPNVMPGAEVYISADVNGGGSGDGTSWRRWAIKRAETWENIAYYDTDSGSILEGAIEGVCEGECDNVYGLMRERIGFTVSSGAESAVLFDGQHHVFSDSEVWLQASQRTDCETGEQSHSRTILAVY